MRVVPRAMQAAPMDTDPHLDTRLDAHGPLVLRSADVGWPRLRAQAACGHLTRAGRGVYVQTDPAAEPWETRRVLHDVRAAEVTVSTAGVLCLESAVLAHGGRVLTQREQVHVVVDYNHGGLRSGGRRDVASSLTRRERREFLRDRAVVRHRYPLETGDVVECDGRAVTSLECTIIQCARFLEPDRALVAVDSLFALVLGVGDEPWDRMAEIRVGEAGLRRRLLDRLAGHPGQRGVARARAVIAHATALAQSVWETELRRLCLAHGIEAPEVQMRVDVDGHRYFVDLGWWRWYKATEVDGEIKYVDGAAAAREAQRLRQDRVESRGFEFLRLAVGRMADRAWVLRQLRYFLPAAAQRARPVTALLTTAERRRPLE